MKAELDIDQIKKIDLDLLLKFHDLCEKEGFRYSISGGTLIGAVRHQGFIPWDDDIDVMMPRPDYDRFIKYCLNNEIPFGLKSFETDKNYVDLSAKIFDLNTILVDNATYIDDNPIGVNIDIFPIDGIGNSYKKAKKAFKSTTFRRNLLIAAQWKKFQRSKTHSWYYEPFRFAFYILSKYINKAKVYGKIVNKYKKFDFDKVAYVAVVGGSYRLKEILPRNLYDEFINITFEGYEVKTICGYKKYLENLFGDFMQLPPLNKRVSHHTFKAYYLDDFNNEGNNG